MCRGHANLLCIFSKDRMPPSREGGKEKKEGKEQERWSESEIYIGVGPGPCVCANLWSAWEIFRCCVESRVDVARQMKVFAHDASVGLLELSES